MPVSVCVDNHLYETDGTGRLTTRTHAARMTANARDRIVFTRRTLPGDPNTSFLVLPWDAVDYEYGGVQANGPTGRFAVTHTGIYHVAVCRSDTGRPHNVQPDNVMVGLDVLVNNVARMGTRVPRLYPSTIRLSVAGDLPLNGGDVVTARWTVTNAPRQRVNHQLANDSRNFFSCHWVGYRRNAA